MEISIYAIPGVVENENIIEISPEEFLDNLNLKSPVIIPKQKFQKIWPIFNEVCELFNENPIIVYQKNKKRDRQYVIIRQLTMAISAERLRKGGYENLYPLRILGGFFLKDHATCIFALKTIEDLRQIDKSFRRFTEPLFNHKAERR